MVFFIYLPGEEEEEVASASEGLFGDAIDGAVDYKGWR